jgi:hypothetical protein
MNSLIEEYKKLPLNEKREVLLSQMEEIIKVLEIVSRKKKIDFDKFNNKKYKKTDKMLDDDYCNLMFAYITCIKEDLGNLL